MKVRVKNALENYLIVGQVYHAIPQVDAQGNVDFLIYNREGYWQKFSSYYFEPVDA